MTNPDHPLLLDYPDWWLRWCKRYGKHSMRRNAERQRMKGYTLKCLWTCHAWVVTGVVAPRIPALARSLNDLSIRTPTGLLWNAWSLRDAINRYQTQQHVLKEQRANEPAMVRWAMIRPTRHNLRWYPINQYVAGERGQSPLLYMGSPYLEFLDLGEGEGH